MTRTIVAVYERGIFKPLQKIDLPEHKRVHLVVIPGEDTDTKLLESQKKELSSIIGIGESGISDISRRHDQHDQYIMRDKIGNHRTAKRRTSIVSIPKTQTKFISGF